MRLRDKLFGFKGRVRRQDWWILGILVGLAQLGVTLLASLISSAAGLNNVSVVEGQFPPLTLLPFWLSLHIDLAFLWPHLSLSAQRFHDRGKSAWPIFAYFGLSIGAELLPASAFGWMRPLDPGQQLIAMFVWGGAWIGITIWFLVVLGFLDGTQGPNRFGPSPKGIGDTTLSTFD